MKTKLRLPVKVRYFLYSLLAVVLAPFVKPKYRKLFIPGRRKGNTTRLVDMFVQDFFNKSECQIYDHYGTRQAHERTMHLVLQRLSHEHNIQNQDIYVDRNRLVIRRNNRVVATSSDCECQNCTGKIEHHRFDLGIKKYGYDSEFRKAYESMTAQLRHHQLNDFFDEWNVPKN